MSPFPWESLLDQLELELSATEDPERRAALCCRLALLHWDVRGDRTTAEHWVGRIEEPWGPARELRRQLMLDAGDAAGAANLLEEQAVQLDPATPEAQHLIREAALLWLLWATDPTRAAKSCGRLGPHVRGDPALGDLLEIALVVGQDLDGLLEHAEQEETPLHTLILGGTVLLDKRDQPLQATELLERAFAADDEDPLIMELLLEVSALTPSLEARVALMQKKLDMVSSLGPQDPDVVALAYDLARLKGELGRVEEAAALLDRVDPPVDEAESTEPLVRDPTAWAAALLRLHRRDHAVRTRDIDKLGHTYLAMAEVSTIPAIGRVYRYRAAQLLGGQPAGAKQAEQLLRENLQLNPEDRHSARAIERVLLARGEMKELCDFYQSQSELIPEAKEFLLRKAAAVAEAHLANRALAASLRRDGLALGPDPSAHGDLQRIYRAMQSGPQLMEAYQRQAESSEDPAARALSWSILAALRHLLEQSAEAEMAAKEALALSADDPLALAVLVSIYEGAERRAELHDMLLQQSERLVSPANRATCFRRLAALAGQGEEARRYLVQAAELNPGDPATLSSLLDYCEASGEFDEAVQWGLELAQAVDDLPQRAAAVYVRVGRICERGLSDRAQAAQAFQRALDFEPNNLEALEGLSGLHREAGELEPLVDLLRQRITLAPEEAQSSLRLDLARALEKRGASVDELVEAYAEAAKHGAGQLRSEAAIELERVCRQADRLEDLARVLSELPPEIETIRRLAGVLTDLGDLASLTEVLTQLLDTSAGPLERADRTYELGRVLEQLGRTDEAITRYEETLESVALHQPALSALGRLYRSQERLSDLARVLELELEVTEDAARRVEVLVELAAALESVGQKAMATIRLEEALTLEPTNLEVILTLERLYDPNQPLELARVLAHHAEVEPHTPERSAIFLRAGQLYIDGSLPDKALPMLRQAVLNEPGNRDSFTTYEALCYERERWHDLMELYDQAIAFVEHDEGKAYRPVDLYVRKGQLQLNHLSQPGEAVASLLKALEHDPKSESVMKLLESIFLQQQDWLGLIKTYERRSTLVPNNELFRLESLRQAARLATGRLPPSAPEARGFWEQIYSIDPTDEEALDNLERIYTEQAQYEQLADILETRLALTVADEDLVALNLRLAELCEKKLDDPKRAAAAYEKVRQLEEHHEDSLKALARIYEAMGMWERCVEVLRDLVIMEADLNERSLLYFKCGSIMETQFRQDEEAITYYELALHETPACLPAIHGLRDIYLRREDWNKALDTLELEVQLWDEGREQAGVLARMGEIRLHHLKDVRAAMELFEDALAIDADCQPAAMALFDLFYERGDTRRALEMAERLAGRMGKEGAPQQRSRFFSRRGQLQAAGGEVSAAVESLVTALELRPDNLEALDWLIAICRRNPDAYDFATIFRDLEQVYRREENRAAVGHVLVAAGALSEIAGDAETALTRYQEAMEAAPHDLAPVKSLANLLLRLRKPKEATVVLEKLAERTEDAQVQIKTLHRLGEIWSDFAPDSARATGAYQRILALDPDNDEAAFRLAQELFVQGRFEDAHRRMSQLLDRVVTDRGGKPKVLANYAHYMGVILLQLGDAAGAVKQFQYALQLDDRNVNAALGLSRQLAYAGDLEGAKRLLAQALRGKGGAADAAGDLLPLRRGLAALHQRSGDLPAAIEQYGLVVKEGGKVEDRIALAELHAQQADGITRAQAELWQVLRGNGFNPHALQLLADLYHRSGELERTLLVLQVMEMLGWAGRKDRVKLGSLRRQYAVKPAGALDEDLRGYLVAYSPDRYTQQMWDVVREPLGSLFPLEIPGREAKPVAQVGHPEFRQLVDWCVGFVATSATVLVADAVPGGAAVDSTADNKVVIDSLFLERPVAEVAFVVGRTLEYLRSGHGLLSRLAFDDRSLLGDLLVGLLQPPEAQNDLAQEFRRGMPRRVLKQIDDVAAAYRAETEGGGEANQPTRWFSGIDRTANNVGLVACNDISAALRMVAQMGGQELAVGPRGEVAVQLITDGPELVQFFLSEAYLKLRRRLALVD